MKKESKRKGFKPEESKMQQTSLHDLYFTDEIDIEEELRLMESDPKLKGVTGDTGTLDKIKGQWAEMNRDVEMSEDLSDVTSMVSADELAHLSPEARELIKLGIKAKSEESDEPKVRLIRKRNKRILFAVAAIIVLSMAASTTGVTSLYKYFQMEEKGAEEQYRFVDSENDTIATQVNEMEIYQQIDAFFGTPVVKLYGDLVGLEFSDVLIHEADMSVDLVYYWEGQSIFYSILGNYNQTSQMSTIEDEFIEKSIMEFKGITLNIEKYIIKDVENCNYVMTFEYNGLHYKIGASQALEEVMGYILNSLIF